MRRGVTDEARSVRRVLLLGTAALLVVRMALALVRPGPILLSDEIGYLTNARVLAGGTGADLLTTSFYEAGYSLVLVPVVGLVHDPVAAYRLVIVVNALLAASVFPLLYLLLTSGFEVTPRVAVWPALAGACYPSVTLSAGVAMGENLLYPLLVAWLLCLGLLIRARTAATAAGWATAAGLAAAALWLVHARMLVALALTAVVVVGVGWRRRELRPAAGGVLVLAAGLVPAHLLTVLLVQENYGGRDFTATLAKLSRLGDLDRLALGTRNLVAQTWYLLVATLGVVLAFLLSDPGRSLERLRHRTPAPKDVLLGLLLLTAAGLLLVSALSFGHARRADRLVYGRYAEIAAPPLLALALSRLAARRPALGPGVVVAVLLGLSAVVAVMRLNLDARGAVNTLSVGGFPFRTGDLGAWRLFGAGVVAACVARLVFVVLRRAPERAPLVVIAAFTVVTASALQPLLHRSRVVYPAGWVSIGDVARHVGLTGVAYDEDGDGDDRVRDGGLIYPWFLREAVLVRFSGCRQPPPAGYLLSTADWPAHHPARPAREVWQDPARDLTLWALRPAAPVQEAAARSASALPCRS
ncbi:MAG TPA: hypothetical protein VGP78_06680 [Solirubrobacteraceae bacterium]|nr:hypothetical protein [Solirubrobacteraceae bacterium]